jgi:hypothetical protein
MSQYHDLAYNYLYTQDGPYLVSVRGQELKCSSIGDATEMHRCSIGIASV